jgi:hypothetical protein
MKAFEEYWKCGMLSGSPGSFPGASAKEAAAFNWRRALEWFKQTMDEIEEHDLPIKGQEVLEKELADE